MSVCRMVLATSPFPLPTKMNPSASDANDAISIDTPSSATNGRSNAMTSSRCAPAYARPSPMIADVFSGTDLFSTCSDRRAMAASASVRIPQLRIPVASSAPALMYSSDE